MPKTHCFDVLQVPETVSAEELRRAYRRLVRRWHPDQYVEAPGMREMAQERLKRINTAYQEARTILSAGEAGGRRIRPPRPPSRFSGWLRALFRSSAKPVAPRPAMDAASPPRTRPKPPGDGRNFEAIFRDAIRKRPSASGRAAGLSRPRPVCRRAGGASLISGQRAGFRRGKRGSRVTPIQPIRRVGKV